VRDVALVDAVAALRDGGLKVEVARRFSRDNAGEVLAQVPASGMDVGIGSTVKVVVAHALPKVPNVVGKRLATAERTLRRADFTVAKMFRTPTIGRDGVVFSQSPPSGTRTRPGRAIRLTVSTKRCTPGYSTCFPPGPDVDCFGGRGTGPRYTDALGLRVRGNDPYRLDVDGDGIGCELP
jgi:beta-lactam-binding protein with PASTA domain